MSVETTLFLSKDPPPMVARGIATLMILLFASGLIFSVTVSLPETVSAPFTLVSALGSDTVRTLHKGVVVRAPATSGQGVARGDVLLDIQAVEVSDRWSERATLDAAAGGIRQSLENARRRRQSESRVAQEEVRGLTERVASQDRTIALKRDQLDLLNQQLDRFRRLSEQGLTSLNERSEVEIRRAQTTVELENLMADRAASLSLLQTVRDAEAARRFSFVEEERVLKEREANARIRVSALAEGPALGAAPVVSSLSPCDGVLVRLYARRLGAVVLEGEVVAEVACRNETLEARLSAPQSAIARVRPGQTVHLLLDAYPYQRYGSSTGVVRWVAPGGAAGGAFTIVADLREGPLRLDDATRPLLAGMDGTARIVVGRRPLIGHLLEPLRELKEALR